MKKSLIAGLFALAGATPSFAADAVFADPVVEAPVSGYNWSGFYVGAQAGYGWGDADHLLSGTEETAENSVDGGLVGGYVGYNYQFSNSFVVGADADLVWSGQEGGPDTVITPLGVPDSPNQVITEVKWTAAIRGRLGYAMDRFLPYIAGGVAFANVEGFYDYISPGTIDDTLTGWTIGGGVDYGVTDNLILRAEYRYSDFGEVTEQPFLPSFANEQTLELTSHDVRIGIAYKF